MITTAQYGSGKTTTSRQELYKHIFLTPGGNTIIGANVASQYEQTIKRDIEADIPRQFVRYFNTQKQYMDLINGHRIMYRPFDDPNKLRSYNVSMFIMIEGSEIKKESFTQLKTRLRNMAAAKQLTDEQGVPQFRLSPNGVPIPIYAHDWRKGIIESNPDSGWIRDEVVMVSDQIHKHGNVLDQFAIQTQNQDPAISTHITSTEANAFLPQNFVRDLKKNKPLW